MTGKIALTQEQKRELIQSDIYSEVYFLMSRFNHDFETAKTKAVKHREERRQSWLAEFLDPWCKKHNLTRVQACSVLGLDYRTNGPCYQEAFEWQESNFFIRKTLHEDQQALSQEAGA